MSPPEEASMSVKGRIISTVGLKVLPTSFDCYSLDQTGAITEGSLKCKILVDRSIELWDYKNGNFLQRRAALDREEINKLLADIAGDWSFDSSSYRKVKEVEIWQKVYDYKKRHLVYDGTNKWQDSVYCDGCRILLRSDCVTVDHHKPQSGGGVQAVLKIFRALGLTQAGPKGHMGKQIWKKSSYIRDTDLAAPGTQAKRYAVNETGALFFSLVQWVGGWAELEENCLNHVLNLRPMCIHCNTSKGASLAFF